MGIFSYLNSVVTNNTGKSAKSFSLVISNVIGAILGATIAFALVYDVVCNEYIKSDLNQMGIFLLCVGAYITGSGIPKIFGEKYFNNVDEDKE